MEEYISKSALVAEIEKCIDRCNTKKRSCPVNTQVEAICDNKISAYKEVLGLIDTLEVKEVDSNDAFIKKADEWLRKNQKGFILTDKDITDFINYMKGK